MSASRYFDITVKVCFDDKSTMRNLHMNDISSKLVVQPYHLT